MQARDPKGTQSDTQSDNRGLVSNGGHPHQLAGSAPRTHTIWNPVPHHTLSHAHRNRGSAPDFFNYKFQENFAGFLFTTYFDPKLVSTKGTGMKNKFIHSISNNCPAFETNNF